LDDGSGEVLLDGEGAVVQRRGRHKGSGIQLLCKGVARPWLPWDSESSRHEGRLSGKINEG
jgi:hypothetical protein